MRSPLTGTKTISNGAFDSYEFGEDSTGCFQVVATGLDAGDGTVYLQQSNDNENWDNIGISETLPSGSSSVTLDPTPMAGRYGRVRMTKGTNTTGELYAQSVSKD